MKILDGIVISCVGLALIIGAAFIFPGSEEELVIYKNHGTLSMFKRLLAFLLPGWFMLFGIRFFIFQLLISKEFVPSTRKLAISSLIYSLIPCILGSLYFYLSGT